MWEGKWHACGVDRLVPNTEVEVQEMRRQSRKEGADGVEDRRALVADRQGSGTGTVVGEGVGSVGAQLVGRWR